MTSKGYFKKICKNLNSYEFTDEFKQGKKKIEKDLEVLKILKRMKWFVVYENGGGNEWKWFIDTDQSIQITKKEAEKIKEWFKR